MHGGATDATALWDDDLTALTVQPQPEDRRGYSLFAQAPQRASLLHRRSRRYPRSVACWLATTASTSGAGTAAGHTCIVAARSDVCIPETNAKFYRLELTGAALTPATVMSQAPSQPAREYVLTKPC